LRRMSNCLRPGHEGNFDESMIGVDGWVYNIYLSILWDILG
jgi:hypothetical protein